MEMVRIGFDVVTALFAMGAAYLWVMDFRHSWARWLSVPLVAAGLVNLFADTPAIFMMVTFVIGLGLILYYQKTGELERLKKDVLSEKEGERLEVVNSQEGEIKGKLGRLEFDYVDREGDKTRRIVDVDRVYYEAGNGYFEGFCHTTKARRTFRMDRVAGSVIDHETGEAVDL